MNSTPAADRLHIAFFGKRNTGKSSLVNAVTGQDLVIVSEQKGTTTDPVSKAMELLPLGPVLIIDTPGIDDEGTLGELRIRKAREVLDKTDAAVLVADAVEQLSAVDHELITLFHEKNIPYIVAYNKSDLIGEVSAAVKPEGASQNPAESIFVSAKTGYNINQLKEKIGTLAKTEDQKFQIAGDLIKAGDFVVLVTPIDKAAPKGRLILPQQQTIRDILESDATAIVVKEAQYKETLESLGKKPALVITDSQVFDKVSAETPPEIKLTSFSILFARLKGFLSSAVRGVRAIDNIKNGDRILVCEGCTHHRQCDDIGTVKLPRMIKNHTGKTPEFVFCSGGDFPADLSPYKLVLHCGACMLNERTMKHRRDSSAAQNIPFTNYGITIAHIHGILKRSLELFPDVLAELEQ
jgi:[FeFe] hydrogenase H-cluster maturation GTPase HydF